MSLDRHNYSDILAGGVIGAVMALIGYSLNYPSVFHDDCHLPKTRVEKIDEDLPIFRVSARKTSSQDLPAAIRITEEV
jgi:hypothetical protein